MTFTKEQLIARINQVTAINKFRISRDSDADGLAMDNELLAIALASLEAEPVLYAAEETLAYSKLGELHLTCLSEPMGDAVIPLYTAPPAPVSVTDELAKRIPEILRTGKANRWEIQALAKGCRAAMLQGVDGNSPVIPDGWVAVPVEPTIAILDEFDSIIDYGAEDSKDAWSRLLAAAWIKSLPAAPQQEVK